MSLNISPHLEQAVIGEATARGLTPEEFISEVLLAYTARHDADAPMASPELRMENGIPMLYSSQPMGLSVINDTIEQVRRERDFHNFGHKF